MSTPAVMQDPWLDPFTSLGKGGEYFQDLTRIAETFEPPAAPSEGSPDAPGDPIPVAELIDAPVAPPVAEPETDGPKIFDVDGGGKLTLERGPKGWQATLNTGVDGIKDQVYYGKTKDELLINFGKAQLNATKKIRSQDQKLKLGDPAPPPTASSRLQPVSVRELTADERFEYKTLVESDPIRAMDFYHEKRYGLTPEQFASRLNEPVATKKMTTVALADTTASQFVKTNSDYYPDAEGRNYLTVVRYLGRQYLNRAVTKTTASQTVEDLQEAGFWTLENLEAAKDDLNESGLLLTKPVAPTPAPPEAVLPQPAPPEAPAPARITPSTERPRAANLGLRVEGSTPPVAQPTALSVEDPSNLSDEDLEKTFAALRQSRARGR